MSDELIEQAQEDRTWERLKDRIKKIMKALKGSGVDVVISLLEREEIAELDILDEQQLCRANEISFLSFPITDRSVPSSKREAADFAQSILRLLQSGKSVVIHCRAGIGRSGLMAACVLMMSGVSVDSAFEKIERARGCSVPDTLEQREWVSGLAEIL
jgi:protein-tyrosine phosphatase